MSHDLTIPAALLKDDARIGILNRGEAALRFIRAVREYNALNGTTLKTIAYYIDKEENSLFVKMADESLALSKVPGFPGKQKSPYLDHELLLEALNMTKAGAIWVGWGFVSEDSVFAQKIEKANIVFLGPSSEAMAVLGDKIQAKELADKSQVPILPWSKRAIKDLDDAKKMSEEIGYPVIVKAANAGGGRGIRFVRTPPELEKQFISAREETIRITGNDVVFIEYLVERGRHLEVQVLADRFGHINTFGVRDCSVQRKNQKIIEETPPPSFDPEVIREMEASAARLIKAADYVGAGTVEYLFDLKSNRFFFMEVNTRLQVEHPITETLYGIDLVKGQIDVARGLEVDWSDRKPRGSVIEVRLNAEDPDRDFSPAPGLVSLLKTPAGPGIRVDSGIEQYSDIPSEFDSMVAKIIASGSDRQETISRLKRALTEMRIRIKNGTTNRAFLLELLSNPDIMKGGVHTGFVEELLSNRKGSALPKPVQAALLAGAAEVYHKQSEEDLINFQDQLSRMGRPRNLPASKGYEVNLSCEGNAYSFIVRHMGQGIFHIESDGTQIICQYIRIGQEACLYLDGQRHNILMVPRGPSLQCEVDGIPVILESDSGGYVTSPSPAIVLSVNVKPEQEVKKGDILVVLEAMKMEMLIEAPSDGVVKEICVIKGAQITAGQNIVQLDAIKQEGQEVEAPLHEKTVFKAGANKPEAQWEVLKREFFSLFLGYDSHQNSVQDFENLSAFVEKNPQYKDALAAVYGNAAHYYSAVENLFLAKESVSESFSRPVSYQEMLSHYFRRSDDKGLPADFIADIKTALACYPAAGVDEKAHKSDAIFYIFKSHCKKELKLEILKKTFFQLEKMSVNEKELEGLVTAINTVIQTTQDTDPSAADAALHARYMLSDRSALQRVKDASLTKVRTIVASIDQAPAKETLESVIDAGPYVMPELTALAAGSDKKKASFALTLIIRRMNRDRQLDKFEVHDTSAGLCVSGTGSDVNGTFESLFIVVSKESLAKGLDLAAFKKASGLSQPEISVLIKSEESRQEIEALLADMSKTAVCPCSFLTIGFYGKNNIQHHVSFCSETGVWVPIGLRNGFSPLQYRELRVFRLVNFTHKIVYRTENVFLLEANAINDKKETRLIALVDVSELETGSADDISSLVLFETLYMEAVLAMRAAQARYKYRLQWNRIVVHIRTLLAIKMKQLQEYGDRLIHSTKDLGLEKLVVYTRRKRWSEDQIRAIELNFSVVTQGQIVMRNRIPSREPLTQFDDYVTKVVRARQRGNLYPYEIIRMLTSSTLGDGESVNGGQFAEYDINIKSDGSQEIVNTEDRPYGQNESNLVFGIISNLIGSYPVAFRRVIILSDSTNDLGSLAEPECRRVNAALDLAEREKIPVEWIPVSSGAKINMESGTENLDWTAATLRRIIEFTQNGGEINIIVTGVNVGAQSYWNSEATMLMHTKGILVMTEDASMLLTGKRALDFSGSVSGENNLDIGGADKIMGPNGQAQFKVSNISAAYRILFDHYINTYVPAGRIFPPKKNTTDPNDRDITTTIYKDFLGQGFENIGEIFSIEKNPERKKPFDIRQVMKALIDQDTIVVERWRTMQDADTAIVWETRMGGNAIGMIGIESRNIPRIGEIPFDGPESWSGGTLFPMSSKKVARGINAFSGRLPLVIIANLSGFDGSPESLRRLQLEYGAEIGRAIVNYKGPISFVVVARYHGGAYVVFSKALNPNLRSAALEGSYASVIGGAPAAAVVFPKAVTSEVYSDPRIIKALAELKEGKLGQKDYDGIYNEVKNEIQSRLGQEFDKIHSVERAKTVGSIDDIIKPQTLRPYVISVVEQGMETYSKKAAK